MHRIYLLLSFLQLGFGFYAESQVQIKPEPSWLVPVSPLSNKDPRPNEVSNGYYYTLMNRQVNLVNQTVYLHFIRQIINESGVQDASEISVNFAPQFQQVAFHHVSIIRDGKSVNQLQVNSIKSMDDESNQSDYQYNGIKRAYIILKDVQKGDLVDVSYSVTGFNPVFEGRFSQDFYFDSPTPVFNYFLSILAQTGRKLYFKTFNQARLPEEKAAGKLICYQWINPPLFRGSTETNVPSWYSPDPHVTVSEYENWNGVVNWGLKIFNNYQYSLPPSLAKQMNGWHNLSGGDADDFANLALRFVQDQVRYLGLEIGSYTHHPHPPATTYNQRFGDCKDKAILLATILRKENINAFVALTNTSEKEGMANTAPSPLAFNHAIVAIPRSSGYIFIDPTIAFQRGELVNAFIPDYGWALVLKPGENQLVPIAPGFLNAVSTTEELRVHFNDDTSRLQVTTLYRGGAADDFRAGLASSSIQETEEVYLKYYAKIFDGARSQAPLETMDDSLKNEITVKESYQIPRIWEKSSDGKIFFDIYEHTVSSKIPNPAAHSDTVPLALEFPLTQTYTLIMDMPEDWSLDMEAVHIKNESYQFDFSPVSHGNHLVFTYFFKTFQDHIAAKDLSQYKADYKEMEKGFSLGFSRLDFTAPANKTSPQHNRYINWITIWLSFFIGVLFTILYRFLNKRTSIRDQRGNAALPLGGWIVFLGITLIIRLALQGYYFWNAHYYLESTWLFLAKAGGAPLQYVLIFEMILSLFSMASLCALLIWFFGRRDIFPSMFIYYVGIILVAQLLLLIVYYNIHLPHDLISVRNESGTQLVRMIFYTAIWVTFVLRSENVKHTFVYPHN